MIPFVRPQTPLADRQRWHELYFSVSPPYYDPRGHLVLKWYNENYPGSTVHDYLNGVYPLWRNFRELGFGTIPIVNLNEVDPSLLESVLTQRFSTVLRGDGGRVEIDFLIFDPDRYTNEVLIGNENM